jgi:purine-binding chemotaxis protein CheW
MLKSKNPDINLKIIAHDNDLIKISMAPGIIIDNPVSGAIYDGFLTEGSRGSSFSKIIKDSIIFEYHDITHNYSLPKLDMVVIRDTLSFLPADKQIQIFRTLDEILKPGGILILGANEKPADPESWEEHIKDGVAVYTKK